MENKMTKMPPGEPRSVPDAAGEAYDKMLAELRARREAEDSGDSPLDLAGQAWRDFQSGPRIPRPNTAESFIPVIGPAWEAVGDLQDGNYGGAAFNGAMAVADALPVGPVLKGAKVLRKGIGIWKDGSLTANAASKAMRRAGLAGSGEEIHHAVPLNGTGRNVQDWRNHYAFLKVLPVEQHRRLTGRWMGKPMYDPLRQAWYGTTDWMKTGLAAVTGYGADALQNLVARPAPTNHSSDPPSGR
jgi:hypothetical protein